jgi:N-glycosylase/DNA lyase
MLRSPTVYEEVIKTICTTNCAWSATVRMTTALVEHLGDRSAGDHGRTFPRPEAMAQVDEDFYRDVVRAGYRGAYLKTIAAAVATGELDLEQLHDPDLSEAAVAERLLSLPGVGPYAAAHVMMLLGRYSSLVLDSWTRPTYARLTGKKKVADSTIIRRFRAYGPYAGLAFWLFLTRDWVPDPAKEPPLRLSAGEPP